MPPDHETQCDGNRTPPLRNNAANDLLQRYDELLMQERQIQEEYDNRVRNQLTEERMFKDVHSREAEYKDLCDKDRREKAEIEAAKNRFENNREKAAVALSLLHSEEELYQKSYSEYLRRSREIDEDSSRMEADFERASSAAKAQYNTLLTEIKQKESEIDHLENEIGKADETKAFHQVKTVELTEVRSQITAEEQRAHAMRAELSDIRRTRGEQEKMIAEAEHQLEAIRSQHEHELRMHKEHKRLLSELHILLDKSDAVTADYKSAQKKLADLEAIVRVVCSTEGREESR